MFIIACKWAEFLDDFFIANFYWTYLLKIGKLREIWNDGLCIHYFPFEIFPFIMGIPRNFTGQINQKEKWKPKFSSITEGGGCLDGQR